MMQKKFNLYRSLPVVIVIMFTYLLSCSQEGTQVYTQTVQFLAKAITKKAVVLGSINGGPVFQTVSEITLEGATNCRTGVFFNPKENQVDFDEFLPKIKSHREIGFSELDDVVTYATRDGDLSEELGIGTKDYSFYMWDRDTYLPPKKEFTIHAYATFNNQEDGHVYSYKQGVGLTTPSHYPSFSTGIKPEDEEGKRLISCRAVQNKPHILKFHFKGGHRGTAPSEFQGYFVCIGPSTLDEWGLDEETTRDKILQQIGIVALQGGLTSGGYLKALPGDTSGEVFTFEFKSNEDFNDFGRHIIIVKPKPNTKHTHFNLNHRGYMGGVDYNISFVMTFDFEGNKQFYYSPGEQTINIPAAILKMEVENASGVKFPDDIPTVNDIGIHLNMTTKITEQAGLDNGVHLGVLLAPENADEDVIKQRLRSMKFENDTKPGVIGDIYYSLVKTGGPRAGDTFGGEIDLKGIPHKYFGTDRTAWGFAIYGRTVYLTSNSITISLPERKGNVLIRDVKLTGGLFTLDACSSLEWRWVGGDETGDQGISQECDRGIVFVLQNQPSTRTDIDSLVRRNLDKLKPENLGATFKLGSNGAFMYYRAHGKNEGKSTIQQLGSESYGKTYVVREFVRDGDGIFVSEESAPFTLEDPRKMKIKAVTVDLSEGKLVNIQAENWPVIDQSFCKGYFFSKNPTPSMDDLRAINEGILKKYDEVLTSQKNIEDKREAGESTDGMEVTEPPSPDSHHDLPDDRVAYLAQNNNPEIDIDPDSASSFKPLTKYYMFPIIFAADTTYNKETMKKPRHILFLGGSKIDNFQQDDGGGPAPMTSQFFKTGQKKETTSAQTFDHFRDPDTKFETDSNGVISLKESGGSPKQPSIHEYIKSKVANEGGEGITALAKLKLRDQEAFDAFIQNGSLHWTEGDQPFDSFNSLKSKFLQYQNEYKANNAVPTGW